MAIAPVESSSVVINSTNGIEMPMSLISVKESKAGSLTQVVPEYHKLKNKYQQMWARFTQKKLNEGILSWREEEDALNRRMNIVGQNGNTGEHYEKPH